MVVLTVKTSPSPSTNIRFALLVDVRDESPLTVAIWAHLTAHRLTEQLWAHGVITQIHIEIGEPAPPDDHHETLTDYPATTPTIHDSSR
jgi:hypothetical protein